MIIRQFIEGIKYFINKEARNPVRMCSCGCDKPARKIVVRTWK